LSSAKFQTINNFLTAATTASITSLNLTTNYTVDWDRHSDSDIEEEMRLLHLVYIHGFQVLSDRLTSFSAREHTQQPRIRYSKQSIPNLQERQTYFVRDEELFRMYSTESFCRLSMQPPGPVILLGHSMGGLLAAEAANHASNNYGGKPSRIVGVIAFDTPYLGMHPHVVITGIASLFRDKEPENKKTLKNGDLNVTSDVTIVDGKITDDWEAFKSTLS
ncbi:hypothetical protein H0H93_015443, partial [Arthromyces matolae]